MDRIPLFIRAGSIIPKRKAARAIESGTNDELVLEVYPGREDARFTLIEDDGLSNAYLNGDGIAQTLFRFTTKSNFHIEAVEGTFEGMNTSRDLVIRFMAVPEPTEITHNGIALAKTNDKEGAQAGWSYHEDHRVLTVTLAGTSREKAQTIQLNYD